MYDTLLIALYTFEAFHVEIIQIIHMQVLLIEQSIQVFFSNSVNQ